MTQSCGRRGAALVIALVLLTVASLLSVLLLKTAVSHARQLQRLPWRLQAEAIAEAGVQRAAARLASDPEYTGETWQITAEQLGETYSPASVEIRRDDNAISVVARYPDRDSNRIQITRQFLISR